MISKPVCYDASREIPEIYSGVPSFMGLPTLHNLEELNLYDLAFMGIPWEGACTYDSFSGCELFVKTIRAASVRYGGYLPEYDIDAFDVLTGCDIGDVSVLNGDFPLTASYITSKYQSIMATNTIPIVFGGDHSISIPLIDLFASKFGGNVGILHFDCHFDNLDHYDDHLQARCTPFKRIYENNLIDPSKIVHFGIRGPRNTPDGMKHARRSGAHVMTINEVKDMGWKQAIAKALDIVNSGTEAFYVSICSDIMDIAFNPEGALDGAGLSSYEMCRILYQCGLAGAKGCDYVEVYPDLQGRKVSSHVACYLVINFLCGLAQNRLLSDNQPQ